MITITLINIVLMLVYIVGEQRFDASEFCFDVSELCFDANFYCFDASEHRHMEFQVCFLSFDFSDSSFDVSELGDNLILASSVLTLVYLVIPWHWWTPLYFYISFPSFDINELCRALMLVNINILWH